jgi:hypothetical protein
MSKHFDKMDEFYLNLIVTTDRSITYNVLLVGDGWVRNLIVANSPLIKTSTNY